MQSRYYNPEWGRFINADAIIGQTGELLAHNMFAYCKNNPINKKDNYGFLSSSVFEECGSDTTLASNAHLAGDKSVEFNGSIYGQILSATGDYYIGEYISSSYKKGIAKSYTQIEHFIDKSSVLSIKSMPNRPAFLKVASKVSKAGIGALGVVSTGINMWDNHAHYRENVAFKRDLIDGIGFGLSIAAGAFIGSFTIPAVAAIGVGLVAGVAIGWAADQAKSWVSRN